jgi:hypothetical protein
MSLKTAWTESEDVLLRQLVEEKGPKQWGLIATQIKTKSSKQVRNPDPAALPAADVVMRPLAAAAVSAALDKSFKCGAEDWRVDSRSAYGRRLELTQGAWRLDPTYLLFLGLG